MFTYLFALEYIFFSYFKWPFSCRNLLDARQTSEIRTRWRNIRFITAESDPWAVGKGWLVSDET